MTLNYSQGHGQFSFCLKKERKKSDKIWSDLQEITPTIQNVRDVTKTSSSGTRRIPIILYAKTAEHAHLVSMLSHNVRWTATVYVVTVEMWQTLLAPAQSLQWQPLLILVSMHCLCMLKKTKQTTNSFYVYVSTHRNILHLLEFFFLGGVLWIFFFFEGIHVIKFLNWSLFYVFGVYCVW